jgi:LysM repeat protein
MLGNGVKTITSDQRVTGQGATFGSGLSTETRRMKRVFDQRVTSGIIIFGLLILLAFAGHAEEITAPLTKGSASAKVLDKEMDYLVKKGDTLWDISKRFYGDPFLWPRLWQQNQYITNPHHIAPGDRIRLYPYKVLIEVEEQKPPTVEEPKPLPPAPVEKAQPSLPSPPEIIRLVIYPEVNSAGFITDKMEGIGRIVGADVGRLQLTAEDEIYINFQKGVSVQKGDQFTIFRVGDPIEHPVIEDRVVGRKVLILGTAVITKTSEKQAQTALITRGYDTMVIGDEVTPYFAPREELAVSTMEKPLYGWIVASKLDKLELVVGDVVYIDLGEDDHVRPGHIFQAIRRRAVVKDLTSQKKKAVVRLPDEIVARLVVIKTQQKTSTAVIVQTRLSAQIGDEVASVAE